MYSIVHFVDKLLSSGKTTVGWAVVWLAILNVSCQFFIMYARKINPRNSRLYQWIRKGGPTIYRTQRIHCYCYQYGTDKKPLIKDYWTPEW